MTRKEFLLSLGFGIAAATLPNLSGIIAKPRPNKYWQKYCFFDLENKTDTVSNFEFFSADGSGFKGRTHLDGISTIHDQEVYRGINYNRKSFPRCGCILWEGFEKDTEYKDYIISWDGEFGEHWHVREYTFYIKDFYNNFERKRYWCQDTQTQFFPPKTPSLKMIPTGVSGVVQCDQHWQKTCYDNLIGY